MNDDLQKFIDSDIAAFFLNIVGSIATLFIVINDKRRIHGKTNIPKDKTKSLQEKLRILFLLISLYFLITSIINLNDSKEKKRSKKKIKKQELEVLASLLVFLSSLISLFNKDDDIFFI